MTDKTIIAAMYGNTDDEQSTVQDIVLRNKQELNEESYIEKRDKYATINIDGKKVSVPTEKFMKDLEKKNADYEKKIKNLDADNRKLRATVTKLTTELNRLSTQVDNKMDKL